MTGSEDNSLSSLLGLVPWWNRWNALNLALSAGVSVSEGVGHNNIHAMFAATVVRGVGRG